jgi:hypothetical protein
LGYLLFITYLVIICWLLTKINFVRNAGIGTRLIIGLFLIRVAASILYNFINIHYYNEESDVTSFNRLALDEFQMLLHHPKEYFSSIFENPHNNHYSGFFDVADSYWNDLKNNIIIKMLSVSDLLSFGNIFINGLLFNFLTFFSSIYLYRVFIKIYPTKKTLLIISVFLLPSLVYFSSGFHREGLIFLALGILIYNFYHLLKQKDQVLKRTLYILLSLITILLLRNFVFVLVIPALLAWYISEKKGRQTLSVFVVCYAVFITLFFLSPYISPKLDAPNFVYVRQEAFLRDAKRASSAVNINPLYPNFRSFLNNAPQALNHSLMRPYLTERFSIVYVPTAIEIFLYEALFVFYLFYRKKDQKVDPVIYFGIFFSMTMFLAIGYTTAIIGAIVRYRSIYLPFLIAPMLCSINWPDWKIFRVLTR